MAFVIIVMDQLSKWLMLSVVDIANRPPIEVTPFFNLVMVWNYGVSFGMLSQPGTNVVYFLIGVAFIMVGVLLFWLWRATDRWVASAIGLIIGGALGNVVDRFLYGAVADFFDFHVAGYHWPAFNIADSAIFIGVALLLWDGLFRSTST